MFRRWTYFYMIIIHKLLNDLQYQMQNRYIKRMDRLPTTISLFALFQILYKGTYE